jgi:hypothetical protein
MRRSIGKALFSNWQLALLASTGVVLSLASGWTTWDGMRNFTREPVLSLMVTFGIQGVMLIVAWLIGESFAVGMSQLPPSNGRVPANANTVRLALALTLAGISMLGIGVLTYAGRAAFNANNIANFSGGLGGAMLVCGLLIVAARVHTLRGYFDAARVMVRTSVLWVMFLACMATSVFFSFDSLFSTIFPQSERKRAADLRAINQVAGVVADIGTAITNRRIVEADELFRSDGWLAYERQLSALGQAAQNAQGEIEHYFTEQVEERNRAIKQQRERITTAQSSQAGLAGKKISLTEELAHLRGERPGLAAEFARHKGELDAKAKEIDDKRVEALAEDKGVEGTLKVGKGPVFRQRMAELGRLQDEYKVKEERGKDAQRRLRAVETRITELDRELTGVDGDLAKLKGEAQTAEQRIKLAQDNGFADVGAMDATRVLQEFEHARADFRRQPEYSRLGQLQQQCGQLVNALNTTQSAKTMIASIDCDPKQASEAAARVFALNTGLATFGQRCSGGDKLPAQGGADELFVFARKCIQDSGLPSAETEAFRQKINVIELNRDDKANRFVVTLNAFQDGNKLAYLALAIAVAMDGLVFMSGLFGATALRSPLSDVPTTKARSGGQLEAIIENALLPDRFENASLILESMHPITPRDGYTAEVLVPLHETPVRGRLLRVLNAGATIGAVMRDPDQPTRYLVRSELFEFLSIVAKQEFNSNRQAGKITELEKIVMVTLLPDVADAVDSVLAHIHPINESDGYTGEVLLQEIKQEYRPQIRNVLNAGATLGVVRRVKGESGRYEIHGDLFKVLARLRARVLMSASRAALSGDEARQRPIRLAEDQLRLQAQRPDRPRLANEQPTPALTKPAAKAAKAESSIRFDAPMAAASADATDRSAAIEEDVRQELYDAFVENLAISRAVAEDLTHIGHRDCARDISQLLKGIRDYEPIIQKDLDQLLKSKRDALDDAKHKLLSSPEYQHLAHQVNVTAQRLSSILPLLIMTEGGEYEAMLSSIVRKAEQTSADVFPAGEKNRWLEFLQDHSDQMRRLPRRNPEHWRAVVASLQQLSKRLASLRKAEITGVQPPRDRTLM